MKFDEFIAMLQKTIPQNKIVPLKDSTGKLMREGDIIEFYSNADDPSVFHTTSLDEHWTECLDVVQRNSCGTYLGACYDTQGGIFLLRVEGVATIVGNVHTNPEPLRRLRRFRSETLADRILAELLPRLTLA